MVHQVTSTPGRPSPSLLAQSIIMNLDWDHSLRQSPPYLLMVPDLTLGPTRRERGGCQLELADRVTVAMVMAMVLDTGSASMPVLEVCTVSVLRTKAMESETGMAMNMAMETATMWIRDPCHYPLQEHQPAREGDRVSFSTRSYSSCDKDLPGTPRTYQCT
jgi:hypothetical protein